MRIYFGEVNREEAEEYGFTCYEYDGKLFDYCIDFNNENGDVVISDSCDRMVPMCWEGITALTHILSAKQDQIAALGLAQGLLSDEEDALVRKV